MISQMLIRNPSLVQYRKSRLALIAEYNELKKKKKTTESMRVYVSKRLAEPVAATNTAAKTETTEKKSETTEKKSETTETTEKKSETKPDVPKSKSSKRKEKAIEDDPDKVPEMASARL